MPIKLSHIGEDLAAAMLTALAERQQLDRVICAISMRTLLQDIQDFAPGPAPTFHAEQATLEVIDGTRTYACDGAQRVDVLCTGVTGAIAFELKLGESRFSAVAFRERFCRACSLSRHEQSRLNGSMIAILERNMPGGSLGRLVASTGLHRYDVCRTWWLVVRDGVAAKWIASNTCPTTQARILRFEDLMRSYGSERDFDALVQRLVGSCFSRRWGLSRP